MTKSINLSNEDKEKLEFEKIMMELEDDKNIGVGSWSLPTDATPAEISKYQICQKILLYQREHNLSDEVIARKTHLTIKETEDILFCRINKFSLDNLVDYATYLFAPQQIEITINEVKTRV